jgi:hypothetical protein
VDNCKNITNSQNSVRKKSFGGIFSFSNCHIIGLDTGSLVLIVFGSVPSPRTFFGPLLLEKDPLCRLQGYQNIFALHSKVVEQLLNFLSSLVSYCDGISIFHTSLTCIYFFELGLQGTIFKCSSTATTVENFDPICRLNQEI